MVKDTTDETIRHLPPDRLKPWARNPRTHSRKQMRQIIKSIRTFGFTNPVLIDEDLTILAGHGRVAAAKEMELETVPCRLLSEMTEAQKRAYVIADNRLALNAGWDEDLLAEELGALYHAEIDFDVDVTGFSVGEIDMMIEEQTPEEPGDPADDTVPETAPQRCRPGDIWQLGRHRLICGDARDAAVVELLMAGERARMVFTDPPYNVPVDGHVCGLGQRKHREFAMASGEMTPEAFTSFLETVLGNHAAHSLDGAIHFVCMDWRHQREILAAGAAVCSELKNLIVWVKDNGGMGSFYRSRHELIVAFKVGTAEHVNTFELGQHGRYRTNVWEYRGATSRRAGRMEELALHPTVKPVQMIADAIRDVSGRGEIVLDLFGGSGSTLIAAEKTGRRGFLAEIDPVYCDRILKRWEDHAQDEAERVLCGLPGASGMGEAA